MSEVVRRRRRPEMVGMTGADNVGDAMTRTLIRQLQCNIDALQEQIDRIRPATVEEEGPPEEEPVPVKGWLPEVEADERDETLSNIPIFEATDFPPIYDTMPMTWIKIFEEDVGWTNWHAQGDRTGTTGDADTIWAPAMGRWTELTGEPSAGFFIEDNLYDMNGNGNLVSTPPGLRYTLENGNWVAEKVLE